MSFSFPINVMKSYKKNVGCTFKTCFKLLHRFKKENLKSNKQTKKVGDLKYYPGKKKCFHLHHRFEKKKKKKN